MVTSHDDPTRPIDHVAFAEHIDRLTAVIDTDFGGDYRAYFAQHPATGYLLTPTGWALRTAQAPGEASDLDFAVSDRDVLRHRANYQGARCAHGGRCDGPRCNDYPVTAEGIWVSEYDSSDEPRIATQIGTDPFDRTPPGPGAEPVLVTGDFDNGGPVFWPEAFWFDRKQATYALTAALTCDHQVDYDFEGARRRVETKVYQTADGRWVGRLTDPTALNDQVWRTDDEIWCALDERYVAHLMYCRRRNRYELPIPKLDLFILVVAIERATRHLRDLDADEVRAVAAIVTEVILPQGSVRDLANDRSNQAARHTTRPEARTLIERWGPIAGFRR